MSPEPRPDEQLKLEIKRVVPALVDSVFAAISDSDKLRKWWGPAGFTVSGLNFQPQVGERYRIRMQPGNGESFFIVGEFREVERASRLAYTFAYEEPDEDDIETLVSLTLRDLGGSTEVVMTQGPFKTEARRALHQNGWQDSFDKLEQFIIART